MPSNTQITLKLQEIYQQNKIIIDQNNTILKYNHSILKILLTPIKTTSNPQINKENVSYKCGDIEPWNTYKSIMTNMLCDMQSCIKRY